MPSATQGGPGAIEKPLFESALAAAEAIRRKRISSFELTSDVLRRIEGCNDYLNAIVTLDAELALEEATAADRMLACGVGVGSLHGVPCTVKDSFKVRGMRTTAGAGFLTGYVPDEDATVVARLRKAGAIVVGKTNTARIGGDWQTYNSIFGVTNNPWDLSRTTGGSSGGAAAALAAGLDYVGVGSDLGGSIRGPAHFCGVCGHKPSANVVSLRGHIPPLPPTPSQDYETLAVAGPLARAPEDLELALRLMGGPDGDAPRAYRWVLPPARKKRVEDYRIGYVLDDPCCPVSSQLLVPLHRAIDVIRESGASVREGWPRGIFPIDQNRTYEYLVATYFASALSVQQLESLHARAARRDHSHDTIFAKALTQPIAHYQRALTSRIVARMKWQEYFRTFDVFLMPVTFLPAFKHDLTVPQGNRLLDTPEGKRHYLDLPFWTSFASLAGLPATTVPVGTTDTGLPVGLQVLGPYLEDATPLALAAHIVDLLGRPLLP